MVSSRMALGSVSTFAAAALLLGAAPMVLRSWTPHSVAPWGTLASFSGNLSSSTPSSGDRSQLLKLAALKSSKAEAGADPAMTVAAQLTAVAAPVPAQVASAPVPSQTVSAPAVPVSAPAAAEPSSSDTTVVEQAPVVTAAADATGGEPDGEAVPLPPSMPSRASAGLININRATSEALDHFPGAGHIGRAIVSHRPYHAIDDLLKKRVLRTSDFQRIQGRISVD